MSLKHTLAIALGTEADAIPLAFAAEIAAVHKGVAEVLAAYPDSAADMIALGVSLGARLSQEAVEDLAEAERGLQARIESEARRAANRADLVFGQGGGGPRMILSTRGLRPALALARQSVLADLIVFGQDHLTQGEGGELFNQTLLGRQAPVLLARGDPAALSGPMAIAWDGSAQAGRAVKAALPLLAMASAIHIIQCVSSLDRDGNDPDVDRLNAYLSLHGVGAGVAGLAEGADEGGALLALAEAKAAGVLVAGAWGHARLREAVFGGATRAFLRRADGPSLLLAH